MSRLPSLRRETTEASQPRLPCCGQVPQRGARLTAWLARTSRVRAQHLKLGEGRGPRRRRVRGAAQRTPRHHRPERLLTRRRASRVLRHQPRDVQVYLPPAGPEEPRNRTAPTKGPRLAPQPAPSHGG